MNTYFKKFKEGFILGIGLLVALSFGVFAYQFTDYTDINDVESEQILTKDTFNQLLANVRSLNNRVSQLRKGTDIVSPRKIISECINGSITYSNPFIINKNLNLDKGIYYAMVHSNGIYSATTWNSDWVYTRAIGSNVGDSTTSLFFLSKDLPQGSGSFMFSVREDNSTVNFQVSANEPTSYFVQESIYCYSIDVWKISD